MLSVLFGDFDIDTFLANYRLSPDDGRTLNASKALGAELLTATDRKKVADLLDNTVLALEAASARSLYWSAEVSKDRTQDCAPNTSKEILCRYQMFDLLRLYQTITLSLSSNMIGLVRKHQVEISPNDFLRLARAMVVSSAAVGLLDSTLVSSIDQLVQKNPSYFTVPQLTNYIGVIEASIKRAPQRIKGVFADTLTKYRQVTPATDKFIDDTLRSSAVLPLSNLLSAMYQALQKMTSAQMLIGKERYATNYRVLNPGIATGVLHFATDEQIKSEQATWDAEAIYFLPKTPATLQKVAGIITADSGSMISHVQLLAGNHGLPNLYVPAAIARELAKFEGKEILLISLPNGEARIKLARDATADERIALNEYLNFKQKERVTIARPSGLGLTKIIALEQLRITDSGKVAGGKAAGQGELAALFPAHVPKAIVLPFGVYNKHVADAGLFQTIKTQLSSAAFKSQGPEAQELRANILKSIRKQIQNIDLDREIVRDIKAFIERPEFKDKGFFVRSDTNAEDLDQFVGAGLNDTVPNVIGLKNVLDAVKRVWSSPFTEKALSWRSDLIVNPWDVYPSVIIQVGISSTKAGVMIAGNPETGDPDDSVFIAANEGVGITVVNGEYSPEETIYSRKTGATLRLRKAYAPKRKILTSTGIQEVPSLGLSPLVTDREVQLLAKIADKTQRHLTTVFGEKRLWDFEYGVVNGRPVLFQIRKFIGNKILRNTTSIVKLQSPAVDSNSVRIGLDNRTLILPEVTQ
jgi:hypothetical protein